MTALQVAPAREADASAWDEFVRGRPDGTFCHHWGWGGVFRQSFGHQPRYLVARDEDGQIEGVLPMVRMRGMSSRHLISMPYLNYGGPIGTERACAELTRAARAAMEPERARRLELRSRAECPTGLPASRSKVTVLLPLPDSVEELWTKTFRAKLRSQVRRAQKERMEVCFGDDQVDGFYRVFSRNMRDLGTPVLPRRFFAALPATFPAEVVFGVVRAEGVPIAAGCGFLWNGEFEMTWASSLREHNAKAPNMLLYASFMEEMIRRGAAAFNFGRCTPGGGTHRFKLQWGGHDEPLHWSAWPGEEGGTDEPGGAYQLASRMWQRLPVPVAELVGPVIAARLPQF